MRRRLDLRWRINPNETRYLIDAQLQLLKQASEATQADGKCVYSTCSIAPEENELLVKRFLQENPEWQLETERALHPTENYTDGAYAALLSRS